MTNSFKRRTVPVYGEIQGVAGDFLKIKRHE